MTPRDLLPLVKETLAEVMDDDVLSLSAATAYYGVFSLPPLLVVVVAVAGALFGAEAVRDLVFGEVEGLAGAEAARTTREMIESASDLGDSPGSKVAGIVALLFGATGAFAQLQAALNRAWEVKPKEQRGGLLGIVLKRVLSFGMILTIAFLLLVSLALSAVVSAVGGMLFGGMPPVLMEALNFLVSFGVSTLLFAAIFVVLPDTRVAWRDVWVGAAVTAGLFAIGKTAIGLYMGQSDPGSAFGAAGSLALILLWIYYSSLIVLVGAEFTQVYACRHGSRAGAGSTPARQADGPADAAPALPKAPPIRT